MAKLVAARKKTPAKHGAQSALVAKQGIGGKKGVSIRKKDTPHVVEQNGSWVVKSARSGRPVTPHYGVKGQAIDAGRRIARVSGGDLLVHGRSGQIFQHSPIPSEINEESLRKAIRLTMEQGLTKVRPVKQSSPPKRKQVRLRKPVALTKKATAKDVVIKTR